MFDLIDVNTVNGMSSISLSEFREVFLALMPIKEHRTLFKHQQKARESLEAQTEAFEKAQ